jgi:hypothetical protein
MGIDIEFEPRGDHKGHRGYNLKASLRDEVREKILRKYSNF